MSAYLVSDIHISALVSAAAAYGTLNEPAELAADRLKLENARSLIARYGSWEGCEEPCQFTPRANQLTADEILGALSCYEYQACEHAGWSASNAHGFCASLEAAVRLKSGIRGRPDSIGMVGEDKPSTPPAPTSNDRRWYGAKYDRSLSTPECAKRFRADVKAAILAGDLPKGLKLSVQCDSYSGGSSIDVRIKALPFAALNPGRESAHADQQPRYTPRTSALLKTLEGMLGAYNHDGSDSQSDYFDVKFYGRVEVSSDLECSERTRIDSRETLQGWDRAEHTAALACLQEEGGEANAFYRAERLFWLTSWQKEEILSLLSQEQKDLMIVGMAKAAAEYEARKAECRAEL